MMNLVGPVCQVSYLEFLGFRGERLGVGFRVWCSGFRV